MKNYRFKHIELRAYNKTSKKMLFSHDESVAFAINSSGFSILSLDSEGNIYPETLGDDTDTVLMQGAGFKDHANNMIYEGDVVFMRRPTKKGLFPIIGVVNAKDFTFSVNSGINHYTLSYSDKDLQILGNIFETSDEALAKKGEDLLKKYEIKK